MSARSSAVTLPARVRSTRPAARPGTAARTRLQVAPEVARRRLRARILVWGAAVLTVASVFLLVAFHVVAVQSAFQLERLSKEKTNEQLRYERLREQVANLSSAEAVIRAATQLGMVPAAHITYIAAVPGNTARPAADPGPAPLSTGTYQHTKQALDRNP